jgi:hypothetical protein
MIAWLKWGAIVGVLAYAVELAFNMATNALLAGGSSDVTARPVLLVPICLGYFALLFACSAAGFYTARETGRARLGALAGMLAFALQSLLGVVADLITGIRPTVLDTTPGTPLVAQIIAKLLALILVLGVAASLGLLGGRPGAQRARRLTSASEPAQVSSQPPA